MNHSEQRLAGPLLVHEERDGKRAIEKAVQDEDRGRARLASEAVDEKVSQVQCRDHKIWRENLDHRHLYEE